MARVTGGTGNVNWEEFARVEAHPLRISIMEALWMDGGRTLSATELAYELFAKPGIVTYHVGELVKNNLLWRVHTQQVAGAGALEHFYCPMEHSGDDLAERLAEFRSSGRRRGRGRR